MLRAKLFAALLLLGVLRVEAQTVCGSAATGALASAATYACTCPTGTGVLTAVTGGAITGGNTGSPTYSTVTSASFVTTVTVTSVAANNAVTAAGLAALCKDLMPGYSLAIGATASPFTISSIVTACTTGYCAGFAGAFAGQALPTGVTGTVANLVLASSTAFTGTFTVAAGVATVLTCPANTASNTGFTSCTLNAGYSQGTAITGANVIAAPTACAQNYYCPGGGNAATVTGSTVCPNTGVVGTGSGTAAAAATNTALSNCLIGAGYYVSTYTAASGSTPASATVAVCPANSYCPGYAVTATNSVQATYVVSGAGVGAVACPFVTVQGDASSNSAAVGNTAITSCVLDAGYYQTAGTAATTTALATATVAVCASNYFCAGNGLIATTVTNSNNGASACPYATTVGDATYTPYPGTSSNAITDCYTKPGYFVAALTSVAGSGALCQVNEYCPGGFAVPSGTLAPTTGAGVVGNDGSVGCPTGTTLAVAVAATAATANNDITDCVIPSGKYVSTIQGSAAALNAIAVSCTATNTPVASCTAAGLASTPGALTNCPTGASCVGGAWSDVVGYGITSILPNYVVTAVTSSVPSVLPCGTTALVASCTAAGLPWSLCTGAGAGSASNFLLGASCTGASSSHLLTVGYGATVSNTDYYVSAPGVLSSCPLNSCTLGQSLTTAGGASIPAGYYVSAVSGTPSVPTVLPCPTGSTCAGASYANMLTIGYGVTINSGYYLSSAGVVTICPTGATCAGASVLTVGTGFAVSSGYVVSTVTSGVATVIACPTGAVCSGGSGTVPGTGAVTSSGYYVSSVATSTAIAGLTACGSTDVCVAGLSLTSTATGGRAITGGGNVNAGYYQVNGSTAATAVYAICPTGATCPGGTAGTLYTGATAAAGYYVSAAGAVSACPTGAVCAVTNAVCTALATPFAWCTAAATGTPPTAQSIATPGGIYMAYPGYMSTAVNNGNAMAISACPTGAVCAGDTNTANGNDLPYSGATTLPGYYVSAPGTVSACPAGSTCTGGQPLSAPGGGTIMAGFYVATAGSAPALCPSGMYCPGGGNLGVAGGSFVCPANSTLAGCNDFADNAPASTTVASSPVSVAPAATTVSSSPVTVTPAAQPITVNVTVPAPIVASAAPRAAAHAAVLALAALAAVVAF